MNSINLEGFMEDTASSNILSVIVNRDERVEAEFHKNKEALRPIYSATKSFTSTAVGMAIDEGLFSLDDKVVSFFEGEVPLKPCDRLKSLKVEDLLVMAMGHMNGYLMGDDSWGTTPRDEVDERNWVKYCFERPMPYNPGEKFVYDNSCAYILGVIVQKTAGCTLSEYLKDRLFEPLGINEYKWEKCPMGYDFGAGGLQLKAEDFSKLGLLYLNSGRWNGKQIISEVWVKESTRKHIDTNKSGDWGKGYGYQFWMGEKDSYRADGKYGQLCIVIPKKRAVITIMAKSHNVKEIMSAVWEHIYPQL